MNNRNFTFNPLQYEKHLSVFGKTVLHELINKWSTDQNRARKISSQPRFHQSTPIPYPKQVLTFRNENTPATVQPVTKESIFEQNSLINETRRENNVFNNSINTITMTYEEPITVNTVESLLTTIQTNNHTENIENSPQNLISINDLSYNNVTVEKTSNLLKVVNVTKTVDWNDMFDTDLLPDDVTLDVSENSFNEQTVVEKVTPQIENTQKKREEEIQKRDLVETKNEDKQDTGNAKKTKRKNQKQVTDTIPKKVKKDNAFRKQNYNKTVKNWLNNVDTCNTVERAERNNENRIEIVSEKKDVKKTVQAQLANKDGIMKFSKPVARNNINNNNANNVDKDTEKTNNTVKPKKSEKKSKPKFVAPIKSQIPVKEVTYDVREINIDNVMSYKDSLDVEVEEIIAILIYRNGFSELNKHHTDDQCDPEGMMINVDDQRFYYYKLITPIFKDTIADLLRGRKIKCLEGKQLLMYLKRAASIDIYDVDIIDVKIGAQLLEPDSTIESFNDVQRLASFTAQFTIATDCPLQKAAWYSTLLRECAHRITNMLNKEMLWKVFNDIEMKLLPVITDMEHRGVLVDTDKLKSMEEVLITKMRVVEQKCYKAAGKVFQINSTVQVRAIIYDELQLDTKCNIKIKETVTMGAKSTSEAMLRNLVSLHPLPRLVLEYRHLHKAHATFVAGIAQHVKQGIVTPTWVQLAAATGRIASNNPNLQAIPKAPFELVLYPEENEEKAPALCFRVVYRARAGHVLLCADFQHVECRVFAHLAHDDTLTAALHARDLFTLLAAQWLQKPEADVSSCERERTKRVVYAALYGAGVRRLADVLRIQYQQALDIHASFNRTFPSVKRFWSAVSDESARCGRVRSVCGRLRGAGGHAQDVNFVIQGSAADLCKLSMVSTSARLRTHDPPVRAHLILQIHDELVWEVDEQQVDLAAGIIRQSMECCGRECGMAVPLPVALSAGRNWGEMHPYQTPQHN